MPDVDQHYIDSLVANPSEKLVVEIKNWIDPDTDEGKSKIIKNVLALYNLNGGYLVIGFNDKKLKPEKYPFKDKPRVVYHPDKIQLMISQFASTLFEVIVGFSVRNRREFPVIIIPSGVLTPVAAKKELISSTPNKPFIQKDAIYFRSLSSNGTPSTNIASHRDLPNIMKVCFDNREGDIASFFKRHLQSTDIGTLINLLTEAQAALGKPNPTLEALTREVLEDGEQRFQTALASRKPSFTAIDLQRVIAAQNRGSWEVALTIMPLNPNPIPDKKFFDTVTNTNPAYTGWPVWLDSRDFRDRTAIPAVMDGGWQALIIVFDGSFPHFDFMRFGADWKFYQRRLLEDDLTNKIVAKAVLDPILIILRITESIAVGLSMAQALECPSNTKLGFAFRWKKLKGRKLNAWSNPGTLLSRPEVSQEDTVETFIEVPIDTPMAAIPNYVDIATKPLFAVFGGYSLHPGVIEEHAKRLLDRKLY